MQTVTAPQPMNDEQYIRKLEAENAALRARLERARIACEKLIDYRDHNVLNFQLEKADDFIRMIRDAVTQPEDEA